LPIAYFLPFAAQMIPRVFKKVKKKMQFSSGSCRQSQGPHFPISVISVICGKVSKVSAFQYPRINDAWLL
jgi:hypothetical protein